VCIYDLAVAQAHRRWSIAKALIQHVREIGARRGARVVFVQADSGDAPAIALYEKPGSREKVLHFGLDRTG
jgi:aminoglycoside 3-N-acetyltransferase I